MTALAKKERNYGIDLLRLVSMFFVVTLHSLLFGGALSGAGGFYEAAWAIEAFAFGAVNIFGLISGYVGYRDEKKPFKIKSIVNIWGLGLFYSVAVLAVFAIVAPNLVTRADVIENMTPVFHNTYWYLTAYIFLLLMMPILNAWVRELTKKQCKHLAWALLIIVALLSVKDLFYLSGGYSAIWLAVLYLMGALMKKGGPLAGLKKRWCVLGIMVCTVVLWAVQMASAHGVFGGVAGLIAKPFMLSYISPVVLFSAMLFVKLFSGIKFKNKKIISVIEWAAPSAFGIFLLNSHPLMRVHFTPACLKLINDMLPIWALLYVLAFTAVFFVAAIVIDKIRHYCVAFIASKTKVGK